MTKDERKAREKAARAEYILNSAESLMMERGFNNVKIEDIAEASGYAKRTLYLYFKDRRSIYYSLVQRGQNLLLEALEAASEEVSRSGDLIAHYGRAFYGFSISNPAYFEMVMDYESRTNLSLNAEENGDDPSSRCSRLSRLYGDLILRSLKEDMERRGLKSSLTPEQILLLLWSQIFGFMQVLLTRQNQFESVYSISPQNFFNQFIGNLNCLYERGFSPC